MKDIVFDLGGVLIDWNPRYLYKKIFPNPEEMEYFLTQVCHGEWNAQMDAGLPFAEGLQERRQKYPQYAAQIDAYFARWPEMLGGAFMDTVSVLKACKRRGARVYALTNWSAETLPYALERYDFFPLFDGMTVSGEVKLAKPDPAIFQRLLADHGLCAQNCIFIDDNAANASAAARLGFCAVRFTNAAALTQKLTLVGVL